METDHFVKIDRGVVYITERRSHQVFPDCLICGHVMGQSCVEYSVWGQSCGVV